MVLDPVAVLGGRGLLSLVPQLVPLPRLMHATILLVNHTQMMGQGPGHSALSLYATQRLAVRFVGAQHNAAGAACGLALRARCTKNTLAPPFQQGAYGIDFTGGSEDGTA